MPGHASRRRPQPDDIAEGCGVAQRAAHVTAVGERLQPGRERRGGAAAAAARRTCGVVRISGGAEDGIEGVGTGGEFGNIGLAEADGAGPLQPVDEQVVLVGDVVGEER